MEKYLKTSIVKGLSFGLTSGAITTLGMMVGLFSFTGSKLVVIGGIISIAIADSFSDALGIHISEESENKHTVAEIWEATICTFFTKLLFASTFIIPVLIFDLNIAILASIFWGASVLAILSYYIAKSQSASPIKVIFEHLLIAFVVVIATYYVGKLVNCYLS